MALCTDVTLKDGRVARVRPLAVGDADVLGSLFLSLSERTRGSYGPHPFDRATAAELCARAGTESHQADRFVAVLEDGKPQAEIVGYMILTRKLSDGDLRRYAQPSYGVVIDPAACAAYAPVVRDDLQEQGLGTAMARHVLACAPALGLRQVILMGGVQARNERGRRLYQRLGFRTVGEFDVERQGEALGNYDMILELGYPPGSRFLTAC